MYLISPPVSPLLLERRVVDIGWHVAVLSAHVTSVSGMLTFSFVPSGGFDRSDGKRISQLQGSEVTPAYSKTQQPDARQS
jgi:hypothetical protein